MLGLKSKGHLGPGEEADITIYSRQDDVEAMFRFPRYVFKAGQLIIDDGEIRATTNGQTLMVRRPDNTDAQPVIRDWFQRNSTIQFENFPVDAHDVGELVQVFELTDEAV